LLLQKGGYRVANRLCHAQSDEFAIFQMRIANPNGRCLVG